MDKHQAWAQLEEILTDSRSTMVQRHLRVLPEVMDTLKEAVFSEAEPPSDRVGPTPNPPTIEEVQEGEAKEVVERTALPNLERGDNKPVPKKKAPSKKKRKKKRPPENRERY